MTTTFRTDVDGAEATVVHTPPLHQTALIELDAEELCQLLSAKAGELEKQSNLVDREKKKLKTLETQHGEIVDELRKRGDATASGQTGLFEQRIVQDARAAANASNGATSGEPMPARGEKRLALAGGSGTAAIIDGETGATHADDGGAYIRIPQPNNPDFCVCGSLMTSKVADHDREHAEYVATLGAELAPATITKPGGEAEAPKRVDGRYRMTPDASNAEVCVCGWFIASQIDGHDERHERYAIAAGETLPSEPPSKGADLTRVASRRGRQKAGAS